MHSRGREALPPPFRGRRRGPWQTAFSLYMQYGEWHEAGHVGTRRAEGVERNGLLDQCKLQYQYLLVPAPLFWLCFHF